jgi:hypothetical protein
VELVHTSDAADPNQIGQQELPEERVTLVLLSYNQERYIEEAVLSALHQTYSPLEIVYSDDCSRDETFQRAKSAIDAYRGPHEVLVNRNDRNLGIVGNLRTAIGLASGDWVVVCAGDDISDSARVAEVAAAIRQNRRAQAVFSAFVAISDDGRELGTFVEPGWPTCHPSIIDMVKNGGGVGPGATYAYHRRIIDAFIALPTNLTSEDRILPLKAALLGDVVYVPIPLVSFRESQNSTSRDQDYIVALRRPDHRRHLRSVLLQSTQGPEPALTKSCAWVLSALMEVAAAKACFARAGAQDGPTTRLYRRAHAKFLRAALGGLTRTAVMMLRRADFTV